MTQLIFKLRNSIKLKKILEYALIASVFCYIFCVPSFSARAGLNIITYFVMILVGLLTISYCFLYNNFKLNFYYLIIPAFSIFAFVGTAFFSHQFRGWLTLILLAMSFLIFSYAFKCIGNKFKILKILSLSLFLFTLYFYLIYWRQIINAIKTLDSNVRLGGYFDNVNSIAAFMIVAFVSSTSIAIFSTKKINLFYLVPSFSFGLVGLMTGSRTFIVTLIVTLIILVAIKFKRRPILLIIIYGVLIFLVILFFSLPVFATINERFIRFFGTFFKESTKIDTSALERTIWMQYGFNLGAGNLITGYGYNGFGIFSGVGTYTHSNLSEVLCDYGIIGMFLFYLPLIVIFIYTLRNKKQNLPLVIVFTFYYLLISFSNVFYYNKTYYIIIALLFSITFNEEHNKSSKRVNNIDKLTIVCESMKSGGCERVIAVLSDEFVKNNIDVSIIMLSETEQNSFYKVNEKVKLVTIYKKTVSKGIKRVRLLRKSIKELNPDIVISFLPHVNVYTSLAIAPLNIPHVVSERNNPYIDPKNKILRILKKLCFYKADGVVFQTLDAKYFYSKKTRKKSTIICNPVVNRKFHHVSSRTKNIISVGRLTEQKNHKYLIESFFESKLYEEGYKLKIYGEGPLKKSLINLSASLHLSDSIIFMGNDELWYEKEKDAGLFVLSSNYEGMPNALLEALCVGIPSISTNCPSGGPKEIINSGINGILVECGNVCDLSKEMRHVVLDKKLQSKLSTENKETYLKFSSNLIAKKWINYLIKIVNNFNEKES